MDLNDFLIHRNAWNIRLSRNLITQYCGDRFHEYINDNNLTWERGEFELTLKITPTFQAKLLEFNAANSFAYVK